VLRASAGQLELFGVPPPGHPYWTERTLQGMAERYPGLDLSPWSSSSDGADGSDAVIRRRDR
jgi:hypothetical protein